MTKFLIDSSSWIHFINGTSPSQQETVFRLLKDDLCVTCGIVVMEVLRGARNPKEGGVIKRHFKNLPFAEQNSDDYYRAAELSLDLRAKGVTPKTTDLLIAQVAMRDDLILFHDDKDYKAMAKHLPLREVRV